MSALDTTKGDGGEGTDDEPIAHQLGGVRAATAAVELFARPDPASFEVREFDGSGTLVDVRILNEAINARVFFTPDQADALADDLHSAVAAHRARDGREASE